MLAYQIEKEKEEIWLVEEPCNPRFTAKTETVFSQCNGYLGVRGCHELPYLGASRGMFAAGFYHRAGRHEVTELVNCPDVTELQLTLEGEKISLESCVHRQLRRRFSLQTGELVSELSGETPSGRRFRLVTKRFASRHVRHGIMQKIEFMAEAGGCLQVTAGINGQITNSGVSHFDQVEARVFEKRYMGSRCVCDDGLQLTVMTACQEKRTDPEPVFFLKRRSVYGCYRYHLKAGQTLSLTRASWIEDQDSETPEGERDSEWKRMTASLQGLLEKGYEGALREHRQAWGQLWERMQIRMEGATPEEEACLAFAQYHLMGMTPAHTNQVGIGSKGLTGEGYMGHSFWDTEIFILPFLTYTFPEMSRGLLEYRWHGLAGARKKARDYGCEGAMYPWEAARSGAEETPLYAALNIHTGKAEKVWSGIKEHHVTADIIYGLWEYYQVTGDEEFMEQCGYEMLIETAMFWVSRAVFVPEQDRYEIRDVIGPDEYTEHVNNNAYTNYMAGRNVCLAYEALERLQAEKPAIYRRLAEHYQWSCRKPRWQHFLTKLYLPPAGADGIVPQDDSFLSKPLLPNIRKYQESDRKQAVLLDYSREEVVGHQVLKQADVVMLMNLLPELFPAEIIRKNVRFYEARTIHDSSLSYCAHAVACARAGDQAPAGQFYEKAREIDLNEKSKDSTDGVHAASLGGIWSCLVQGFAGLYRGEEGLNVKPHLPAHWKRMEFSLWYRGERMQAKITQEGAEIVPWK